MQTQGTKLLKRDGRVDVVKVVERMRDERGALVQHAAQLSYVDGVHPTAHTEHTANGMLECWNVPLERMVVLAQTHLGISTQHPWFVSC